MATNLIKNGDFSQGYGDHRAYKYTVDGDMSELQVPEITNPKDWETFFVHGMPVPWDDDNDIGFAQPEVRLETDVPDPNRIMDGTTHSLHGFGFFKIIDCGHLQKVSVVAGKRYRLTAYAHAWSSLDDDPRSSEGAGKEGYFGLMEYNTSPELANHTFTLGVNLDGSIDMRTAMWELGANIYNKFHEVPSLSFTATHDEVVIFLSDTVMWPYKHNDYYWSQISLVEIDDAEPSPSEPEPTECRGTPRVQYFRNYNLLPQEATQEQFQEVAISSHDYRETVGFSADDAGIGDLDKKRVYVWWFAPGSWDKDAIDGFFAQYYPGTEVHHVYDYESHPPVDPPPVGGQPDPIVHYSGNFVGLQHTYSKQDWLNYVVDARPTVTKHFELSGVIEAKLAQPKMLTVWRKHQSGEDTARLLNAGRVGAQQYVNLYRADIKAYAQSHGMTESQVVNLIKGIVIESLNETIPSNNATVIKMAVEFDCFFSDALHAIYGDLFKAGLLNVAVGNPYAVEDDGGKEIEMMLPCAKLSHEIGDVLGTHSYWACDQYKTYIDTGWKWHAGRWQEWDKVFNQHGYYPTYQLGECGICYTTPESNGAAFMAKMGWKNCGDFPSYIRQIEAFNNKLAEWNAAHQGRCYGGELFVYGSDWVNFDFNPGDLALLTDAMGEYA